MSEVGSPRVGRVMDEEPKTGPLDVTRTLTEAMAAAGVHPAYIHAVRRCGFVLTEGNRSTLTAEQVERWDLAMEEWFAANPG